MGSLGHFLISLGKSVLRIGSCIWVLISPSLMVLAIGFGVAEILGIVEELVDKRK